MKYIFKFTYLNADRKLKYRLIKLNQPHTIADNTAL